MDNHDTELNTKDQVLAKIREKRISMRPRLYFTFEAVFTLLVALMILIVSVALASFMLLTLRLNGHDALLSFGLRGVLLFLSVFPWWLLVLDVLLIVLLETLLRRFKFAYRSPILYLLIGLLALAGALGLVLDRGTSFDDDLVHHADHGDLPPPFGEVYEHVRMPAPSGGDILRGVVTAVGTSTIQMRQDDIDNDGDVHDYSVILPPAISATQFSVGQHLYVAGDRESDDTVRAFGVRPLSP